MRVKTFQGRTLDEILPQIREELGSNAVVLSQRQKITGGVGGFFGTRITEVVAADRMPSDAELVDLEQAGVDTTSDEADPVPAAAGAASRSSSGRLDLVDGGDVALPDPIRAARTDDAARANSAAVTNAAVTAMAGTGSGGRAPDPGGHMAPLELAERQATINIERLEPTPTSLQDATLGTDPARERAAAALADATRELARQSADLGRPLTATPVDDDPISDDEWINDPRDAAPLEDEVRPEPTAAVEEPLPVDMVSLQASVRPAVEEPPKMSVPGIREELQAIEDELDAQGVEDDIARTVTWHLLTHRQAFSGADDLRELARETINEFVRVSCGWRPTGRQHRMAVVGPTGAGKSSVVAKLAESYERNAGLKVGVISIVPPGSARNPRGSADPLADRPHIDVRTVTDLEQMTYVIERFDDADLVIIDTPGSAYHSDEAFQLVRSCLTIAQVRDVQAVVPITTSYREAASVVAHFRDMAVSRLIASKIDETRYHGQLLNFGFRLNLPMSYLSDGPDIPADIRAASAQEIAELILPTTNERG